MAKISVQTHRFYSPSEVQSSPAGISTIAAVPDRDTGADAFLTFATSLFDRLQVRLDSHLADIDKRIEKLLTHVAASASDVDLPPPSPPPPPPPPPLLQNQHSSQQNQHSSKHVQTSREKLEKVSGSTQLRLTEKMEVDTGCMEGKLPSENKKIEGNLGEGGPCQVTLSSPNSSIYDFMVL